MPPPPFPSHLHRDNHMRRENNQAPSGPPNGSFLFAPIAPTNPYPWIPQLLHPLPSPQQMLEPPQKFSNCPGPILEGVFVSSEKGPLDISKPFRVSPDPDRSAWTASSNLHAQMEDVPAGSDVEKMLDERAVNILTEILQRSLRFVYEDENEDRRHINVEADMNFTNAPISWLYVLHLPPLIAKATRTEGLEGLENALNGFRSGLKELDSSKSSQKRQSTFEVMMRKCIQFGDSLFSALCDLNRCIELELPEHEVLKFVKNIFEVTIAFYYDEKGCLPASEGDLAQKGLLRPRPLALRFLGVDSTSTPEKDNASEEKTENLKQEDQKDGTRSLNFANSNELFTIFYSHVVPMTPVVARRNGEFVRGTNPGDLKIMDQAYAYDKPDGSCVIPCDFCLNDTYTPDNCNVMDVPTGGGPDAQRYLTYVGCCFPDGTLLSYIPINNVRLVYESNLNHRQPIMRTGTVTFAFVHVLLPNTVYQVIKKQAKEVFLRHHPDTQFVDHHEVHTPDGRMVKIEVLVKSERTVRIQDGEKYLDYPVLQALFNCRHDICGPSLMHMRFTSTKRGSQRIQLRLILFGITVKRNKQNFNDAIFQLLNSRPGPIQTPMPVPAAWLF